MMKSENIAKKITIRTQKDITTRQIQEAEATTILDQQLGHLPYVAQPQEQVQGLEGVDNFLKFIL